MNQYISESGVPRVPRKRKTRARTRPAANSAAARAGIRDRRQRASSSESPVSAAKAGIQILFWLRGRAFGFFISIPR